MPNISNSNVVFSSPAAVGRPVLTPKRVCRTPANVLPSLPNSSSNDGNFTTRRVSNQSGSICVKLWPMSSIVKP